MKLRLATAEDLDRFFAWRNDPEARAQSDNQRPLTVEGHAKWFAAAIVDPRRELYVIEAAVAGPVGYLRLDRGFGAWLVSIAIEEGMRGRGYASLALETAAHNEPRRRFRAWIKAGNVASQRAFTRAGYTSKGSSGTVLAVYERAPLVVDVVGRL